MLKRNCVIVIAFRIPKSNDFFFYCVVIEKPEIVIIMAPVNQSAAIGSNASFNCTATGNPKPTITWKKDNDSDFIQPVVEIVKENRQSYSSFE